MFAPSCCTWNINTEEQHRLEALFSSVNKDSHIVPIRVEGSFEF